MNKNICDKRGSCAVARDLSGHSACGGAGCGACCGRRMGDGAVTLTQSELDVLRLLAQYAFLPAARRADSMDPICLEPELADIPDANAALAALDALGLIDADYDARLAGCDYAMYAKYPLQGSIGLTTAGQRLIDIMEINGIGTE